MSSLGDHYDEMQTQPLLDDQTIESILAGRSRAGRPELDELASFVSEVRTVASTAPALKVGAQLEAVLAGGLTTDKGDLSATAASNVPGPAPQVAGLPKRRKSMLETIFAKAALAKAAAVLAGLSVATTGAAAANLLPEPAQTVVEAVVPFQLPGEDNGGDVNEPKEDIADPQPNPTAQDNFGAEVSERAQTTEEKGKDFGQSVADSAPSQRPAETPTASNNPGTQHRESAPSQAPAETPTASNNPGTQHRENAPSQAPSQIPTPENNPGTNHRR